MELGRRGSSHGKEVKDMKAKLVALLLAGAVALTTVGSAFADASPPTNGGNGAGMSGQCTGNPADRPAVCPATK